MMGTTFSVTFSKERMPPPTIQTSMGMPHSQLVKACAL